MPDVESKAASPSVSHAASQTGVRADQALFAEALQAAEELQNVASYGTPGLGATSGFDRIDALLLEEIEAEEVEANSSSQSAAYDGLALENVSMSGSMHKSTVTRSQLQARTRRHPAGGARRHCCARRRAG